jgi:hypothetical protein
VGYLNFGSVRHLIFNSRFIVIPRKENPGHQQHFPSLTHFEYRFLNFANPSRVLATEDPAFEDFLPVDDDKFYDAVRHMILFLKLPRVGDPFLTLT